MYVVRYFVGQKKIKTGACEHTVKSVWIAKQQPRQLKYLPFLSLPTSQSVRVKKTERERERELITAKLNPGRGNDYSADERFSQLPI